MGGYIREGEFSRRFDALEHLYRTVRIDTL